MAHGPRRNPSYFGADLDPGEDPDIIFVSTLRDLCCSLKNQQRLPNNLCEHEQSSSIVNTRAIKQKKTRGGSKTAALVRLKLTSYSTHNLSSCSLLWVSWLFLHRLDSHSREFGVFYSLQGRVKSVLRANTPSDLCSNTLMKDS